MQRLRICASVLAVAAAYYVLARVGLALSLAGTASCPIWPASGVALVAAVVLGREAALGVFLGAALANAHATSASILACAVIGAGSAAQALVGARVLGPLVAGEDTLARSRDVIRFSVLTPLVCLISAWVGIAALTFTNALDPALIPRAWLTWWIGDVVGILITAPLLFAWRPRPSDELGEPLSPGRALSALTTVALLYASVRLGFGETFRLGTSYP